MSALDVAERKLQELAAGFAQLPHTIIQPWLPIWEEERRGPPNCHGYTCSGEPDHVSDGLLQEKLENRELTDRILVFVKDGRIAHSGRWDGTTLRHLLIQVGILESTIRGSNAGYDQRFEVPRDLVALQNYLKANGPDAEDVAIKRVIEEWRDWVRGAFAMVTQSEGPGHDFKGLFNILDDLDGRLADLAQEDSLTSKDPKYQEASAIVHKLMLSYPDIKPLTFD